METLYQPAFLGAILAFLAAVFIVAYYLIVYLRTANMEKWARILVNSTEQQFKSLPGERKKELVMAALRAVNKKFLGGLNEQQLDDLAEMAVHEINFVVNGFYSVADELLSSDEPEALDQGTGS